MGHPKLRNMSMILLHKQRLRLYRCMKCLYPFLFKNMSGVFKYVHKIGVQPPLKISFHITIFSLKVLEYFSNLQAAQQEDGPATKLSEQTRLEKIRRVGFPLGSEMPWEDPGRERDKGGKRFFITRPGLYFLFYLFGDHGNNHSLSAMTLAQPQVAKHLERSQDLSTLCDEPCLRTKWMMLRDQFFQFFSDVILSLENYLSYQPVFFVTPNAGWSCAVHHLDRDVGSLIFSEVSQVYHHGGWHLVDTGAD